MTDRPNKPTDGGNELQKILDELATKIHNLSPGDVGSIDRVLLHIRKAKEKLEAREQQAERRGARKLAALLHEGAKQSGSVNIQEGLKLLQLTQADKEEV
jgi:hypothetical protein